MQASSERQGAGDGTGITCFSYRLNASYVS
jgi:hypothetical protein